MISKKVEDQIKEYAIRSYPMEMCGFVLGDEFIPVGNTHENPEKFFRVEPHHWADYALECTAFIHSHPDWYPCPSERDMLNQISTCIPWGIVATDGKKATDITFFGDQVPTPDLRHRTFCHGVTDCYSIIRDWYKLERGVFLKEIPRSWEWWNDGKDLYKDHFKEVGFHIIPEEVILKEGPKIGDVFLANIGHGVLKLNHGGVYTGRGLGLHHITSTDPIDRTRLVREDPIQRWLKYINLWVRYNEEEDNITR